MHLHVASSKEGTFLPPLSERCVWTEAPKIVQFLQAYYETCARDISSCLHGLVEARYAAAHACVEFFFSDGQVLMRVHHDPVRFYTGHAVIHLPDYPTEDLEGVINRYVPFIRIKFIRG